MLLAHADQDRTIVLMTPQAARKALSAGVAAYLLLGGLLLGGLGLSLDLGGGGRLFLRLGGGMELLRHKQCASAHCAAACVASRAAACMHRQPTGFWPGSVISSSRGAACSVRTMTMLLDTTPPRVIPMFTWVVVKL